MIEETGSVGIVKTKYFTFAEPPNELELECGKKLGPITIAYETYGELNDDRSNAVLIAHALSGDAHAAGRHTYNDKRPGWWDNMIGPGKAFDTNKYFVICSNIIGGCKGSTGPSSINPKTGKPFALDFPVVTIKDMVRAQKELIDFLGIEQLLCVAGGSMGGMQVLQWAVSYPDNVKLAIPIATTARLSPQAIAFDAVGRLSIMADRNWRGGNYYGQEKPSSGLSIARMIGHITYLSDKSMQKKFGRDLVGEPKYDFSTDFQVESYLNHQGDKFVQRFDANSYLYITKAMDYFDLSQEGEGSLKKALSKAKADFLVVSFTSDWLFPPYQSKEIVTALRQNNKNVTYAEIESDYGHDAFLLETEALGNLITNFLAQSEDSHPVLASQNEVADETLRPEFRVIVDMVEPYSTVLDLGCGHGELLKALQVQKNCVSQGIELSEEAIQACVAKGLSVYHGDLDAGLADFNDQSVDYIIATNTIQVLHKPAFLIMEMARVGKRCIISVPNFAHWRVRSQLFFSGIMPKSARLPYEWYDSPNIHLTTIKDFRDFCRRNHIKILREIFLKSHDTDRCSEVKILPNLFADYAIFMIEGKAS